MAYDFNGTSDRIDYTLPIQPEIGNTSIPFSVSCWVNLDAVATKWIWLMHASGDASNSLGFYYFAGTPDRVELLGYSSGTNLTARCATSFNDLSAEGWIHFVVASTGSATATNANHAIYENGALLAELTYTSSTDTEVPAAGSFSLGGQIYSDTTNHDGQIAEVGVWDRQITAGEAAALAAGFAPSCISNGLVAYMPLVNDTADVMNGPADTVDGGSAFVHPSIIYPSTYKVQTYPPLVAAAQVPPKFYHHRHHNMAA